MTLFALLAGYKTYVIAALMIAKSIYAMFGGGPEMGMVAPDYDLLMQGMGLAALRKGVASK